MTQLIRTRLHYQRKREKGQSILEFALIFPIMMALIINFIAIMILVVYEQKLEAGVNVAATAVLTVPLGDSTGATAAYTDSFNGTFPGGTTPSFVVPDSNALNGGKITCSGDYLNGTVNYDTTSGVTCTATYNLNFANTALATAVFWGSNLTATVTVYPSAVRQCSTVKSGSSSQC